MIESAASIAELICRYAIFESVYLQSPSAAADELQRALVNLYTAIMMYLSKANRYFQQRSIERILKSGLLTTTDLESCFGAIATAEETVDRCANLVGMQGIV